MRRVAMAASREPQSKSGFAVFLIIWCALTALGIGSVIGGKVGLGVLALLMSAGYAISEVAIRRGSDRAVTAVALARPFFFGGWLIGLAAVIIGERQSLNLSVTKQGDEVIASPLAIPPKELRHRKERLAFIQRAHGRSMDRWAARA